MDYVIKLNNVDLIYRSAESLSFKKIIKNIASHGEELILKRYKALNNISLTLEKGKVYGIIGNNGAGKSTLLRILSGVMSPNSGTVERNYTTINLLALGVGFSKELTGMENIFLNGLLLGFSKKQIEAVIDDIISYSEIGDFIQRPMKTYSSGMVSRLGFSIAIHLQPEVLLIDEVLSVGDTKFREKSFNSIRQIIENENITVVIVSHSMSQIEQLCNSVVWLDKGYVVSHGNKTDVLELYSQYNSGKLTIEEIMSNNLNPVALEGNCMSVNAADYSIHIPDMVHKDFLGSPIDFIREYSVGKSVVKVTKRRLDNRDIFLYFEVENPQGLRIDIALDRIVKVSSYDHLYQKPDFDNRYGENKVTGFYAYLDLEQGSAVISKIYHYKKVAHVYENGDTSNLYELIKESGDIEISEQNILQASFLEKGNNASFFVLLSKDKLFRDERNLENYMNYYYENVQNNCVWCSFFMQPSGTYTKLPYSIEPFTKEGYGYSLHHSSRKDLIPFYSQTRERFFEDIIVNAVLQAYLYQKQVNGVFFTPYTSTWVKKDFGLTASYVDTRLNETFILMLQDFQATSSYFSNLDPLKNYVDFLDNYYKTGNQVYRIEEGVFFPDYFKDGMERITHASLNHQLGICMLLIQAFRRYADEKYLDIVKSMMRFIEITCNQWCSSETGDLYYGVKQESTGEMVFYGNDYVYVTLLDLLRLKKVCMGLEVLGNFKVIDDLIRQKVSYLQTTEYDIFSVTPKAAPGEKIDSSHQAATLHNQLYSDH